MRSPRHFALSAFGIVIGISTFVVFLASTEQVAAVLEKIFPLEQVQVVAPRASLLGKDISKKLDDNIVKTILTRPEVSLAIPRMNLAFPAFGRGNFEGNDLKFEVGGFADGVDPKFVQDDERTKELFRDWMGPDNENDPHRVACVPPPRTEDDEVIQSPKAPRKDKQNQVPSGWGDTPSAAAGSDTTGSGSAAAATGSGTTGSGSAVATGSAGSAAGSAAGAGAGSATPSGPTIAPIAGKNGEYFNPCPDPDRYYCDDTTARCEHRVPIVMSPTMIELYNGQFAKSHGLPIVETDFVKWVTQRGGLSAMRFSIGLGQTTIAGSNTTIKRKPRRVEGVLVGVSQKAMPIGMTMPIQYIQRWNDEFMGHEAATTYSSIIVTLKDRNQIAPFAQWLQDTLDLRLEDSLGEKFATVLFVIRLVLVLISLIIIGISAINIAHNFFMQVTERRRELGLLRAVGATQSDVRMVVLGEAALIGLIGGCLGVLFGVAIASGIDYASAHYLPRFPYKPATWFNFKWWIWMGGLACAAGFAVLGGYLPARRASTMEPAQALTQN
ncbi:MAG TPA: ABC transporter permease [Kofleriaceae bacterium]|nr:ABC transporter permease [Kofleriaceae bacterium]